MQLNQEKLARQKAMFDRWRANRARGIGIAPTGFGKTMILVLAAKYMNDTYPGYTAHVIVPSIDLKEDWVGNANKPGHIKAFGLISVSVFVINTYVTYTGWKPDLLLVDEGHRIANEDSQHFSRTLEIVEKAATTLPILIVSATLEKKHLDFFERNGGLKIIDEVTQQEALEKGFISPSTTYNLGIKLSEKDVAFMDKLNSTFNKYFAYFDHEFDLVRACSVGPNVSVAVRLKNGGYLGKKTGREWHQYVQRKNDYDGSPNHAYASQNLSKNAAQCMIAMGKRKHALQNYPSKLDIAVQLMKKFDVETLAFCKTSDFADKLGELTPKSVVYHTNLKTIAVKDDEIIYVTDKEHTKDLKLQGYTILGKAKQKTIIFKKFLDKSNPINKLISVMALQEGVDFPAVEFILMLAYDSKKLKDTQTSGRGTRIDYDNPNKRALVINLYMIGTQEEKWLKTKQAGKSVMWVTSIDEISPNKMLNLNVTSTTQSVSTETTSIIDNSSQ